MTQSLFSVAEEANHPLLIIPNDEGCLMVLGQQQAQKIMTPTQQIEMATRLIDCALQRQRSDAV